MSNAAERRKAHILGFAEVDDEWWIARFGLNALRDAKSYDRLLAYFEEHEPVVAAFIKHGARAVPCRHWDECNEQLYQPDTTPELHAALQEAIEQAANGQVVRGDSYLEHINEEDYL